MNLRKLMNFAFNIILQRFWQRQLNPSIWQWLFIAAMTWTIIISGQRSQAQTIYVDACVRGPGRGTEGDPYKLLSSAVAAATPGGNIVMKRGLYPETLTINKSLTLTAQDGIVRIGSNGYGVGWRDISLDLGDVGFTNARVYYPSWATGANTQIASPCSSKLFPAVVYAHGLRQLGQADLCSWCADALGTDITKDYLQAEGIMKRLVSTGIIAISFDWNSVFDGHYNQTISPYIVDAINYLGNEFEGSVDLQRIGLVGHSTGGTAAMNAAELLRNEQDPQVIAVGLIAPAQPLHEEHLREPVLVIHGTRDHVCQVGTFPLEIYCKAGAPKHLVVITGANHFGYTDGICLDPYQEREGNCWFDPWDLFHETTGFDNSCEVGGLTGQKAHALQQQTAANYLQAFFSYYLHDDVNSRDFLVQKDRQNCGHADQEVLCDLKEMDVYMWWPNSPETLCQHVQIEFRYILEDMVVTVNPPPVDQNKNGGQWNYIGSGVFPDEVLVKVYCPGNCPVIADAVKFVTSGSQGTNEIIVDNDNVNRTLDGGYWNTSQEGNNWWGEDYLISSESGWYGFLTRFSTGFDVSDCKPVRYFDDLQSLNVQVNVCSCTELLTDIGNSQSFDRAKR